MKKLLMLVLSFAMVLTIAACKATEEKPSEVIEATEEQPAETVAVTEEKFFASIEAKDGYKDAGYVEFISGAETDAEYTFTAENSEAVQWRVYVLDEAFDDGFRYIAQAAEPVLVGDGTVSVAAGQFVYVYCSANEFTTGVVNESAKLNVTVE